LKRTLIEILRTVIKADDREHISDEVASIVVTKEISTKIRDFSTHTTTLVVVYGYLVF
jgi:hypothetical protein